MTHTIQQIINNQNKYKQEITTALKTQLSEIRSELSKITSEDKYIKKQKEKIKQKLGGMKFIKSVGALFFLSKKRSQEYYAWWDEKNQEVLILTYGKR